MSIAKMSKPGSDVSARQQLVVVGLLLALISLLYTAPATAARYWCHDHSLLLASKGKEKQIGTGANKLRDKLRFFYKYELEKKYANLSALIASGYKLQPGQVVFFGEAHSAYVDSPNSLQHYFGNTIATAGVLHWTLEQFRQYKRTKNIVDGSVLTKPLYPMRAKPIQIWTEASRLQQRAEQKLKRLEVEALAYLDYLKKPEVKKVSLLAVSINEFMQKWGGKKRSDAFVKDAEYLANICSGKGKAGLNKAGLEEVLTQMKSASDLILKAHDQVKKHADAACKATDKDAVEQHLKQASTLMKDVRKQSSRITRARIKLNDYNLSKLFEAYKRMEDQHKEIVRDLLNLGTLSGVNFLGMFTGERRFGPPKDYDDLMISIGGVKGKARHQLDKLDMLRSDLVTSIKPFIRPNNWATRIKAKADALVRKVNKLSTTTTAPVSKAQRNLGTDKLPTVVLMESVMAKALKKCLFLDPLYEKYKEALSYYDPAKIFVQRSFDHYARGLDCRDKLGDKKKTTRSIIKLSGQASQTTVKQGDKVNFGYSVSIGDHAAIANVVLQDGVCGIVAPKSGDRNTDGKLDKDETWVYTCSALIEQDTDNRIHVSGIDENGNQLMASLLLQVKVELSEEEKEQEQKKDKIRMLWIEPLRSTVKTEEQVTFTVSLVFEDNSEKTLSPAEVKWEPGPANSFSSKEPGTYLVTAWYKDHRAIATVNVEEGESRTRWEDPISSVDDKDKKAMPAPADAYTWYALCDKNSGDVSYGEDINATRHRVLGGPFAGPRTAKQWIKQQYPNWRCPTSAARGQWNILCNKQNATVAIGKSVDPTRYWIMQGGFVSEKDARSWVTQNCPSWTCSQGGACSSSPRGGGDWAVVCSKDHGGMGLTRNPDSSRSWIFTSGLLEEKDARLWVEMHCPSWRCDRSGQCMAGIPRRTEREPLETPPELDSPFSAGAEVDADTLVKKPDSMTPKRDSGYELGRRLGEQLGRKLVEKYKKPEPAPRTREPDTGVTWGSTKADCSAERKQFNDMANNMTEQAKKLNCEKGNRYSGCALDVVGPFFPYWPDRVFSDEACAKPGYVGCASGAFSAYVGCLNGCNAAWRSGNKDLKGCAQKCFRQIEQAMKRCNANK